MFVGDLFIKSPTSRDAGYKRDNRNDGPRVNYEITALKVRLIGVDGEMLGVVTKIEAIKAAIHVSLDLVEISPTADPPVCKILDYGRFKYEQQKKKAEAKKKQKVVELKEIQMRPMIDSNDFEVKCRAIRSFLEAGHKVKISMRFRGREIVHQNIGLSVLKKVQEVMADVGKTDHEPKLEGKQMIMVISQKKGE